jgi:hypothetical protein
VRKKFLNDVDFRTNGTENAFYRTDGKLISESAVEVPLFCPNMGMVEQENEDFCTSAAQTVHVRQRCGNGNDRYNRI